MQRACATAWNKCLHWLKPFDASLKFVSLNDEKLQPASSITALYSVNCFSWPTRSSNQIEQALDRHASLAMDSMSQNSLLVQMSITRKRSLNAPIRWYSTSKRGRAYSVLVGPDHCNNLFPPCEMSLQSKTLDFCSSKTGTAFLHIVIFLHFWLGSEDFCTTRWNFFISRVYTCSVFSTAPFIVNSSYKYENIVPKRMNRMTWIVRVFSLT